MWQWPSKRRIEAVAKELSDKCKVQVRFMPFQLYPQLPTGTSNAGMPKDDIFRGLLNQRAPDMTNEQRLARVGPLCDAWKAEGLCLKSPPTGLNENNGGRMGSSFDSQRLILLARHQGREDAMIEEVYSANHSCDRCLSDWDVLLGCAERAGVVGAREALSSGWGVTETLQKIEDYRSMGVTAVPVVVIDSCDDVPIKAVLSSGAPERSFLRDIFSHLLATGRLPWGADAKQLPGASGPPQLAPPSTPAGGGGGGKVAPSVAPIAPHHAKVHRIDSSESFGALLSQAASIGRTVVAKFTASWCGPCKQIAPIYASFASQLGHLSFVEVDVDECPEAAHALRIMAMPTFKVFAGGKEAASMQGADMTQLEQMLRPFVGGSAKPSAAPIAAPANAPGKAKATTRAAAKKVERMPLPKEAEQSALGRVFDMLGGAKGSGGGHKAFKGKEHGFGFGLSAGDEENATAMRRGGGFADGFADDDLSELDDDGAPSTEQQQQVTGYVVKTGCGNGVCALPRAPDAIKFAAGGGGRAVQPLGERNDGSNSLQAHGTVKNILAGSLVASASRPHQFSIDADFVTCTQ